MDLESSTTISDKHKLAIDKIVELYGDESADYLLLITHRYFKQKITLTHIMYLGYVVGFRVATDKERNQTLNNLLLCQRQN